MSDFEPSPRSSKRRRTTPRSVPSTKANASPLAYSSSSHKVNGVSRRLFKPKDREDEKDHQGQSFDVQDDASGFKDNPIVDDDTIELVAEQTIEQDSGASESADELAHSELTVPVAISETNALREKSKTPKSIKQSPKTGDAHQKSDTTPTQTRSSGRERKRPRRFSSGWKEDRPKPPLPKGILTPSRKGTRAPRKSVVFERKEDGVEDELGFKDVDQSDQRTPKRSRPTQEQSPGDATREQSEHQNHEITTGDAQAEDALIDNVSSPSIPELPDIHVSALADPAPVIVDSRLDAPKSLVLSRLTGHSLVPLTNLEVEYNKLHSLLSATIKLGEGNSILLLGSRGAGKSCLVETAIARLTIEHAEDFHVVRLNGFLQTDDKLALREIWRQLGREMQVEEDETAQVSSYADTMASLLHLLSHPEELAETLEPDAATRSTKSVIFLLDEFDLFTTHPRQTLLYNLFDIAQARKAPIAVVGCSARVDVSDNLEKRVKSRFSHRWIHLPQAKSFPALEDITKAALMLREQDVSHVGRSISKKLRSDWNTFIEKIFLPSKRSQSLLKQVYYTTKSISDIFSRLYIDIASIASLEDSSSSGALLPYLQPPDSVLNILPYIPTLHLSLLISAARLDAIHNAAVVTFSLVYKHYVDLVSRARLQTSAAGSIAQATKLWNRDVAAGAWEELAEWDIVLPANGRGIEGAPTTMWRCDVVLEEIIGAVEGAAVGMSDVMIKWCKEI